MKSKGWYFLTILASLIILTLAATIERETAENITNPLVYTRLRFDQDFLQIYRRFQRHFKLDERKFSLDVVSLAEESTVGSSENVVNVRGNRSIPTHGIIYYKNDQVEAANLTLDDLIFEALDRTYMTRLWPVYIHSYDDLNDRSSASDTRLVSRQKCRRDLKYLIDRLVPLRTGQVDARTHSPELLAFFDSIAGQEAGLLFGNYHWIGNWRQCSRRQIFELNREMPSNSTHFNGRYCTTSIASRRWAEKIRERAQELERLNHFKYSRQIKDYERFFRVQVGICLPESCDSLSLKEHRDEIHKLTTFKLGEPLRSYDLVELFCLPDETSELRRIEPSGRLWIYCAGAWCLAVLLATIFDFYSSSKPATKTLSIVDKLVSSLSLIKNFQRFVEKDSLKTDHFKSSAASTDQATTEAATQSKTKSTIGKVKLLTERNKLAPNDLLFLNAIKVISMPLILFGHAGMLIKHLDRYALDYHGLNSDFVFHFQASTVFYVDWFFVISGFLTTYLMFVTHKVERNSLVQWLYTLFHRYWRLAPIYLLLFWFSKSVFMYTSHGPNWDYGTSSMTLRGICRRESWIYPLTLTSNLHPIHEECIMPAWYVASDMQFYMITPLILVLLHKSPLLGWLASLGAIGVCISLRLLRYITDPKAQSLELMRPRYDLYMRNNWDMHATYVYPQYRIATYLIGILAGHYTYMVLSGQWQSPLYPIESPQQRVGSPKSSRKSAAQSNRQTNSSRQFFTVLLRPLAFLIGCQLLLTMMFATWPISDLFPVSLERQVKYFTALVYAFDHATAGLGMALFITTIMLGQFKWLRSLMSHPNWTVLSRLNFVAFLIQVELIYWLVQSADRTIELSTLELVKLFCYLSCFTYSFAFVLTIVLEFPLAQLERHFVGSLFMGSKKSAGGPGTGARSQQQESESCESARPQQVT